MTTKNLIVRIIFDILLLFTVLNGWWIVALLFCLFGLWYFHYYIETILAGMVFDSIFGKNAIENLWGYVGLISSLILFFVLEWLKGILRR